MSKYLQLGLNYVKLKLPPTGFEPVTCPLAEECSVQAELRGHTYFVSIPFISLPYNLEFLTI